MCTLHCLEGVHKVVRVEERHESVAFALLCAFVANDTDHRHGGEVRECLAQRLVRHVVAEVTDKETEVVWSEDEAAEARIG